MNWKLNKKKIWCIIGITALIDVIAGIYFQIQTRTSEGLCETATGPVSNCFMYYTFPKLFWITIISLILIYIIFSLFSKKKV